MHNKVSIIIPIRNEENYIAACLDSVFNQQHLDGLEVEVIVADGMSTDTTREIIKFYQQRHPNLILIDNPGRIVPTGINRALKKAQGNFIIRIDGHTTIASDYVFQCVNALRHTDADNVGGRMHAIGENPFAEAVAEATSTPFGVGDSRFHYSTKQEYVDSVYMGAWHKDVFYRIGLFDEELVRNQDDELNYRLRKNGGKILLLPGIKSKYNVRSSPKKLWSQYYQYGFWKVRVLQKHPAQMSLRQFVPPLFVLTLLVSLFLSVISPYLLIFFMLLAGYYALSCLGASVLTAGYRGWKHFLYLPVIYPILHISYGLGFLVGLIKFSSRWGEKVYLEPLSQPVGNRKLE